MIGRTSITYASLSITVGYLSVTLFGCGIGDSQPSDAGIARIADGSGEAGSGEATDQSDPTDFGDVPGGGGGAGSGGVMSGKGGTVGSGGIFGARGGTASVGAMQDSGGVGSGGRAGSGGVVGASGASGSGAIPGGGATGGTGAGGRAGVPPPYSDISAGQPAESGYSPSAVIDVAGGKLLIVTRNRANGNRPSLFRCNLDASDCTHVDISAGQPPESGWSPSALIDTQAQKLLVATANGAANYKLSLFRCALDGTECTHTDISAGRGTRSGISPSAAIDEVNRKILVLTADSSNADKPALYRCNLDGTSCTYSDISAGQGDMSGLSPTLALDTLGQKVLAVTGGFAHRASLFRCELDGTGCSYADISAGEGPMSDYGGGKALVDLAAGKLLAVGRNLVRGDRPSLYRCNLDGTNCSHADVSANQGNGSCFFDPTAIIDTVGARLLVVTHTSDGRPMLFACSRDGSNCVYKNILAGQGYGSAVSLSVVIDERAHRLLVATENRANQSKLGLLAFDL